ncbi:hypothetical protein N7468_004706 [Penicillium chermesinum]|uniref:Uncharacterized protein n=1 Tax=Penicillium chermesinum TaxID=63820 RepID=A0A9W9PBX5_9EURO|nr:uncharacterized protein N7468_004706 [Penicillium chermesinum]KAJ5240087.1 hypothetical protein N7468_004706 [Penicillium chermesinum]KAJ6166962.1 hypothetical protein N7470_002409 [Penicillium chermesinum]
MAPSSPPLPQFEEAKSTTSTVLWQLYHHRPRSPRAIALSVLTFFVLLYMLNTSSSQSEPNFWTKFPSQHPFPERPEDAQVALPQRNDITINDTLPHDLEKPNPQLHILLPAQRSSRGSCRTITSAMILGYPPPTLIGYGHEAHGTTDFEQMVGRMKRTLAYLEHSRTVKDRDIVLLVDSEDVFFQLPPQVLVTRFQNILRKNNKDLLRKYGVTTVNRPGPKTAPAVVQKYTQRVLFGASKKCHGAHATDPGCVSIPESSLPPDVYGWKTDIHPDGFLNRPRWLNPGTVIGQAADLRLIFKEALRIIEQRQKKNGDEEAFTQIYGRQEVVRELERRRTVSLFKEWGYKLLGISDATNISTINIRLETEHRYEYGIGVDFESELFFNQLLSADDVEWLKYSNVTKTSALQGSMGVPREHRLLLPTDVAALPNPFNYSLLALNQTTLPLWNKTLDKLPNPEDHTWNDIPLMTNAHSASVPVLAHVNGNTKLRNTWWEKMWFFPWARALLRRYVRASQGFDAAQSSLLGGADWWDMRGGRGGVWTDHESWVRFADVCQGQERDLFDDDLGPWGKENGDPDEPVYNEWGNLVYGKEPPQLPQPPQLNDINDHW